MSKVLSICLPTYNRAKTLECSLKHLSEQINERNSEKIEIFISDNCSPDETPEIAKKYMELGLPIVYNRNKENVGSNRNFLVCINQSSGKYIWLLGDDDFLTPGSLDYLLEIMENDDYGLIHIDESHGSRAPKVFQKGDSSFLKEISYMITFMSVNIFHRNTVSSVESPEQYASTWFVQIPFYINSAIHTTTKQNIILYRTMLDCGHASASNGGFNFFTVAVANYLGLWKRAVELKWIDEDTYRYIKKDNCLSFVVPKIDQYLIRNKLDANYDLKDSWNIILKEYKHHLYFYWGFVTYYLKAVPRKIYHIIKDK